MKPFPFQQERAVHNLYERNCMSRSFAAWLPATEWHICLSMFVGAQMPAVPTQNLKTPYENGKIGWVFRRDKAVVCPCVVCTHPSCQGCLWKSTWEWRQCLDKRGVSACRSPPDQLCPTEPTPPENTWTYTFRACRIQTFVKCIFQAIGLRLAFEDLIFKFIQQIQRYTD